MKVKMLSATAMTMPITRNLVMGRFYVESLNLD